MKRLLLANPKELEKNKKKKTHILIIPYPAPGHLLPLMDLTHKLAICGINITTLITPKILKTLKPLLSLHPSSLKTLILPLPPHPSIPAGVEDMQELPITFIPAILDALSALGGAHPRVVPLLLHLSDHRRNLRPLPQVLVAGEEAAIDGGL